MRKGNNMYDDHAFHPVGTPHTLTVTFHQIKNKKMPDYPFHGKFLPSELKYDIINDGEYHLHTFKIETHRYTGEKWFGGGPSLKSDNFLSNLHLTTEKIIFEPFKPDNFDVLIRRLGISFFSMLVGTPNGWSTIQSNQIKQAASNLNSLGDYLSIPYTDLFNCSLPKIVKYDRTVLIRESWRTIIDENSFQFVPYEYDSSLFKSDVTDEFIEILNFLMTCWNSGRPFVDEIIEENNIDRPRTIENIYLDNGESINSSYDVKFFFPNVETQGDFTKEGPPPYDYFNFVCHLHLTNKRIIFEPYHPSRLFLLLNIMMEYSPNADIFILDGSSKVLFDSNEPEEEIYRKINNAKAISIDHEDIYELKLVSTDKNNDMVFLKDSSLDMIDFATILFDAFNYGWGNNATKLNQSLVEKADKLID